MLTIINICSKILLVIIVKVSFSKGFYAAALIAYVFQLMVLVFDYIVNGATLIDFIVDKWAGVLGFVLLGALFLLRSRIGMDFILTFIGIMLWIVQFCMIFIESFEEPLDAFTVCSSGILGVILSGFGLGYETIIEKHKKSKTESKDKNKKA